MNVAQKALLTRELSKASTALHNAHTLAARAGEIDLAAALLKKQIFVARKITELNGGPVRVSVAEILK